MPLYSPWTSGKKFVIDNCCVLMLLVHNFCLPTTTKHAIISISYMDFLSLSFFYVNCNILGIAVSWISVIWRQFWAWCVCNLCWVFFESPHENLKPACPLSDAHILINRGQWIKRSILFSVMRVQNHTKNCNNSSSMSSLLWCRPTPALLFYKFNKTELISINSLLFK